MLEQVLVVVMVIAAIIVCGLVVVGIDRLLFGGYK